MSRGTPDYTSDIHRAAVVNLYRVGENETIIELARVMSDEASAFAFVKSALASGATAHLVDPLTGLDTPYTIPAGYEGTVVMVWTSFDQPAEMRFYVDSQLYVHSSTIAPGIWYENDVVTFQVSMIDPTFASSHTIDATVKNLGALSLMGEGVLGVVLEKMLTHPLPNVKKVYCKWSCPGSEEVPVDTVRWKCPVCGKETWFYGRKVI